MQSTCSAILSNGRFETRWMAFSNHGYNLSSFEPLIQRTSPTDQITKYAKWRHKLKLVFKQIKLSPFIYNIIKCTYLLRVICMMIIRTARMNFHRAWKKNKLKMRLKTLIYCSMVVCKLLTNQTNYRFWAYQWKTILTSYLGPYSSVLILK